MIIHIDKIPVDGIRYEGEESAGILNLEEDQFVRSSTPIHYDLHVEMASHELVVRGTLSATVEVECSRCTVFFSTSIEDSSFLRAYEIQPGIESIDVTEDIREGILLHLPSFPVCKPDCSGLCPHCGKNLNQGACDCKQEPWDDKWSALNGLDLDTSD